MEPFERRQLEKEDEKSLVYSPRSPQIRATSRFQDVPGSFRRPWVWQFKSSESILYVVCTLVLNQVPSGVFLDARAPEQGKVVRVGYCDTGAYAGYGHTGLIFRIHVDRRGRSYTSAD